MSSHHKDRVAVLHALLEGQVADNDSGRIDPLGSQYRIHYSLAFVSGITMPYVLYDLQLLSPDFRKNIAQHVHTIQHSMDHDQIFGERVMPQTVRVREFNRSGQIFNRSVQEQYPPTIGLQEDAGAVRFLETAGAGIASSLRLSSILSVLFQLRDHIDQLHIVTSLRKVPWDFLYDKENRAFLSDLFGIGLSNRTMPPEKALEEIKIDLNRAKIGRVDPKLTALHFFNNYEKIRSLEPFKEVFLLDASLKSAITDAKYGGQFFGYAPSEPQDIGRKLKRYEKSAQLIVFSGHFSKDGYVIPSLENDLIYFRSDDMPGNLKFDGRPVVVLGGCRSEQSGASEIPGEAQSREEFTLAGRFLEAGASACVVTSDYIGFQDYRTILERLVGSLIEKNSIGRAIREVRRSLNNLTLHDSTRIALYRLHILGDPTATIF